MAHAISSHMQFNIPDLSRLRLNSMGRSATRRHLQAQLREVDAQIESLLHTQMEEAWHILERAAWSQPAAAEIVWTGRLQLHYLYAVREALIETLNRL